MKTIKVKDSVLDGEPTNTEIRKLKFEAAAVSEIFYLRSCAFNGQLKCKMEANAKAKMEGGLLPFGFWFSKQKTETGCLMINI